MNAKNKLWDKQDGESSQAYEAFTTYRDLGVGRTFIAAAEKLHKSGALIRRWAHKYDWKNRADEWDKTITSKAVEKAAEDYAKMLDFQINLGKMMQAKGAKGLQGMDFEDLPIKYLPSIIDLISTGIKNERAARDIKSTQQGSNELVISVISKKFGGEEARGE